MALQRNKHFPAFLYVLEDPRSPGEIRYVGQTYALPTRFSGHLNAAYRPGPSYDEPLYQWIRGLRDAGLSPQMRVLWQGDSSLADPMEIQAIAGYRRLGFPLLNCADGPGGHGIHTKRPAMSRALAEYWSARSSEQRKLTPAAREETAIGTRKAGMRRRFLNHSRRFFLGLKSV